MSADGSQSEVAPRPDAQRRLATLRAVAGVRATAARSEGRSRLAALAEHGGYRAKFPSVQGDRVEAVIINTGGGVVAGDRISFSFDAARDAALTVSSSTAERIYRSSGDPTEIAVTLSAGRGATLAWLPQATILFSGSRVRRRYEVDISSSARLIMAETTVFGRIASGEVMGEGLLQDSWRARRDGRLAFADATRLAGSMQPLLARPAVAGGARATALLLCMAPEAEDRVDAVRAAVSGLDAAIGVSGWNGMLAMRALADGLETLQSAVRRAVDALRLTPAPAAWST